MKRIFTNLLLLAAMLLPATTFAQGDCSQLTLPYSDNFDSYSAVDGVSMPDCWTRLVPFQVPGASNYTLKPNLTAYGGGKVLNLNGQGNSSNTGEMRIATPYIASPLNNLEIAFKCSGEGLKIYVATDTAVQSTYVLVGTYGSGSMWSWVDNEINTSEIANIPSGNGFIIFAGAFGASGYSTARVDNLSITALSGCDKPATVTVEQIAPYSAVVNWTAVDGVSQYRVSYNTVDDLATATSSDVTGTTKTLQDLDPNTFYYVWVQSICGETLVSEGRTATFTTQLSCYTLVNLVQTSAGFDGVTFGWEFDNRGNSPTQVWTVLRDLTDPTEADVEEISSGETSHFVSALNPEHSYEIDFYTICGDDTSEAVTRPIVFKVCGESQLATLAHNYDMHPAFAGWNYGITQMMFPADVFLDMDTIRGLALHRYMLGSNPVPVSRTLSIWLGNTTDTSHNSYVAVTNMTQVATNVNFTFPVQEWDTIYFTTPFVYTRGSNVIVTIDDNTGSSQGTGAAQWMWHSQYWKTLYKESDDSNPDPASTTGYTQSQRCPDMRFVGICHASDCMAPIVATTSVSETTIALEWMNGLASNWVIEYRTAGAATWTVAGTTPWESYVIEDLTPSTYYEVRVGAVCTDETRYSDILTVVTDCAILHLPFHFTQNDMCAAVDNGFTPCWNWSQYFFKHRLTDSQRGTVYNAGNGEWFMLPAIAEPLQGARLRTWVASSDQGWFKVGVASQSNCSDVVWVDTIEVPASNPNTSHDEYVAYLDKYAGTGNRVVVSPIVNNNWHYMYFFDFHVEPIEACRPPVDLVLDSASSNTLYLSWTPVGEASWWGVYVNGVEHGTTDEPHYAADDLEAYTYYNIEVRSLCSEETSDALVGRFLTDCAGESCNFTIVAHSTAEDGGWYGAHLVAQAGQQSYDFTMLRGSDALENYLVCNSDSVKFTWYPGNEDSYCSFMILGPAGDTLYNATQIYFINRQFLSLANLCSDTTTPGPGPGPGPVSIETAEATAITLAPNPASAMFTIAGLEEGSTVSLIDACGREVMHTIAATKSLDVKVDGFAKGVYFVRIANGKAVLTRKVVLR